MNCQRPDCSNPAANSRLKLCTDHAPKCAHPPCQKPAKGKAGLNRFCSGHAARMRRGADMAPPLVSRNPGPSDGKCSLSGCHNAHYGQGLCQFHYNRNRTGLPLNAPKRQKIKSCGFPGCERPHDAKGWCNLHYGRDRAGRTLEGDSGEQRGSPIGTRRLEPNGYMKIKVGPQEWKYEHRHVMEQAVGRVLFTEEGVHHKNGDKADNRVDNLELWSSSHPAGQRVQDKLAWARQIVSLYGDLPMFEN